MKNNSELLVDVSNDRPELMKFELGLLGLLIVLAVFLTHGFIHNTIVKENVMALVEVPHLVAAKSFGEGVTTPTGIAIAKQSTRLFAADLWVVDEQLFIQNRDENGKVEWLIMNQSPGKKRVSIYLTKSADYGILQASIDGKPVGPTIDLYEAAVKPNVPVDLGSVELQSSTVTLTLQVVGKNPAASPPYYQFGIQGVSFVPE